MMQNDFKRLQNKVLASVFVLTVLTLPLGACSRSDSPLGPLATPNPFATPTPTPFSPSAELPDIVLQPPVPIHNPDGTWGGFPGPTEASTVEILPPIPRIPISEGAVNILILGSDTRPGFYGSRTDTVMIISLDTKNNRVTMISIPRDLYVYIPGWKVNRINTADQRGGPETVALTILYNLGIEIHHWARISFNGFISAVNTLGGIEIDVPQTIVDECDEVMVRFPAGMNHMDGYTALCYARVRKASSDFARTERQQQVIKAVFNKVLSVGGISKVPQLYGQFGDLVDSDMDLVDILPLVPLAASVAGDTSKIEGFTIDLTMVTPFRTSTGAAVLLPKRDILHSTLISIFSN
jgi:LCP family protein required for cell wall assembly